MERIGSEVLPPGGSTRSIREGHHFNTVSHTVNRSLLRKKTQGRHARGEERRGSSSPVAHRARSQHERGWACLHQSQLSSHRPLKKCKLLEVGFSDRALAERSSLEASARLTDCLALLGREMRNLSINSMAPPGGAKQSPSSTYGRDIVDFPDVFCQDCQRESSRPSPPTQLSCTTVRHPQIEAKRLKVVFHR